jgi:hypothetical protein
MPKSTYLDNSFINVALRNTAFTPPATVYVALYTVAPGVGGGGTEVSTGSYARQTVAFTAPVAGVSSNTADIKFPEASADWGTIVAFALLDASSGGNLLYFGNLSSSRLVLTSDQVRFPTGQLIVTEA